MRKMNANLSKLGIDTKKVFKTINICFLYGPTKDNRKILKEETKLSNSSMNEAMSIQIIIKSRTFI